MTAVLQGAIVDPRAAEKLDLHLGLIVQDDAWILVNRLPT